MHRTLPLLAEQGKFHLLVVMSMKHRHRKHDTYTDTSTPVII